MKESSTHRPERVASRIAEAIGDLLVTKVNDPRIQNIRVTHVEVSHDLKNAKVLFYCGKDVVEKTEILRGLKKATPFLRTLLASSLQLRVVPALIFREDTTVDTIQKLDTLFSAHIQEDVK